MIPVETVIRKLIVEYEFVVLPGFGALLSHQVPVHFDKDTGLFSPPVKKLAFNEFLKLDDGLLANYISRHEHISHLEAVVYVKRYTDRLRAMLQARGVARIEGIGEFSSNIEGKLEFDPNTEKHFKDEWYGFRNINARLYQANGALTSGLTKHHVEEEVEVVEDDVEKATQIGWWRWAAAAMLVGLIGYFSVFFVSGNSENKSTLNPFPGLFESKPKKSAIVKNDKGNATKDVLLPIVTKASESATIVLDSPKIETTISSTLPAKPDPVLVEPEAEPVSEGKFFVIAGAFKGNKQANVLLNQLKKKGFEDALLLSADKYNNRVKVAVKSYALESDAYAASRRLKDVIGEIGWVYEQK